MSSCSPYPSYKIAHIIRVHFDEFSSVFNSWQYHTLRALALCRTPALGWHEDVCTSCGTIRYSYNSCRNRHCPKGQATNREKWIMNREAELLPVPYFHVVFTLPDVLNELCLANKRIVYSLLFSYAFDTLYYFCWDKKFLGAQIGITAILHTWGQSLCFHPHLHCIVPTGGISFSGRWKHAGLDHNGFIFPVKAFSKSFRGKFYFALKKLFNKKKLSYDKNSTELLKSLYKHNWVVYAKKPFGGPKQVIEYLGRYTHKTAISNHRLKNVTQNDVSFSYMDYRDGKKKVMSLSPKEFLRRFSLHILPKGFVRIRHFGFLSGRLKKNIFPVLFMTLALNAVL